ncbi:GGDEF domain-containing protein, partial [bacterium]|nr:GGDEF domain-containing protein [bacterium]
AREFVFTQRIANIMNQMIYFFNTQTEKSQKEFQRDPLMKIFTRRYLMDALEKETIRAQRYQRPLVFILVDIDHFKNFNDTYGHLMGDKVLQQTAKILKAETRETDIIARYGGEEIAIILSETELKDGTIVAEKLREAVEKNKFSFQKQTVHVTISLGVTILDNTEDTIMTLIHRADEALYTAKQNGRNQVCEKIT